MRQLGLEPAQVEDLVGAMAVRLIEYVIAGMRRDRGEGREDKHIEKLLEKVFAPFAAHIVEEVSERNATWLEVHFLSILKGIYETYRDGYIETRRELLQVLKKTFAGWGLELTPGQLTMMTPDRATISKQHGGPSQFAKFVLGKLDGVHWKTVHNWSKAADEMEAEAADPLAGRPFGIVVTPNEIRAFIDKYADFEERAGAELAKKVNEATSLARNAVSTAFSDLIERIDRDEEEDPEAAQARERASARPSAGQGRPRRRSK